ncbi:MAG TPA: DUF4330 domain-containing protein [Candidatus Gastranaerophilaceae bacterium]|nr:DUF4330 domain-containing protein [Candidatus Gastranaerophilaceae bacterium]HPT41132.1 DUF4330 domain-containing protein [Candidatus Gastranaerophilaceae bacterium]
MENKKLKLIDIIVILGVFIALVVGFLTYKNVRQTASNKIEGEAKIAFQVFLRGITLTTGQSPIRFGDKTFISIRNVPYTELQIIDVKADSKKTIMPSTRTKEPFVMVEDLSQPFMYDVVVTVIDDAKITDDGAVVGGNKVKIGLPIVLEGKDYKFNGLVSNVQILSKEQVEQIKKVLKDYQAKMAQAKQNPQLAPVQEKK